MNTGYFLPVNVDGFQRFAEDGEAAAYYQFAIPSATLATLPGITVPQDATAVTIQAQTDIEFCQSPVEAASDPAPMTLPAGAVMELIGRDTIQALCIRLSGAGAVFTIQWRTGAVGPLLQLA